MRRPSSLRVSDHINLVPLQGRDFSLMIHGYSMAVDIVAFSIGNQLQEGAANAFAKSPAIENLLLERGYLTTKDAEEEAAFVASIRKMYEAKRPSNVGITFQLVPPSEGAASHISEPGFWEHVFTTLEKLNLLQPSGLIEIDITRLPDENLGKAEKVLMLCRNWGMRTQLAVTDRQLQTTLDLAQGAPIAKVNVIIEAPAGNWFVDQMATPPASLVLDVIGCNTEVELLMIVDELGEEELDRILETIRRMKTRIQVDAGRYLTFIPISAQAHPRKNAGIMPLSWSNLSSYRALQSYIWSPHLVRFRPAFLSSSTKLIVSSSGALTAHHAGNGGPREIARITPAGAEIVDQPLASLEQGVEARPAECCGCRLSLLCGSDCRVACKGETEHFSEKLRRFGPLLVPDHQFSAAESVEA